MVVYLITGVIVGVLLGLALAPVLQAWLLWHQARELDEQDRARDHDTNDF